MSWRVATSETPIPGPRATVSFRSPVRAADVITDNRGNTYTRIGRRAWATTLSDGSRLVVSAGGIGRAFFHRRRPPRMRGK